jgi:hypothetical protein
MKKKILYLMHVDWHWIKQRPHFLAEELSKDFDLVIAHPRNRRRELLVLNSTALFTIPLLALPLSRFKFISTINEAIRQMYHLGLLLLYRPSVIWITYPTVTSNFVLSLVKNKVIVYDCMDDAPQFKEAEHEKALILNKEKHLLSRADIVLVSSQNLWEKVLARGANASTVTIVRNAFGGIFHEEGTLRSAT